MEALRKNQLRLIGLKTAKRLLVVLIVVLVFDFFLFPAPVLAQELSQEVNLSQNIIEQQSIDTTQDEPLVQSGYLPANNDLTVKYSSFHLITAYNSEVGQTDDSPCITANGFNLCQHGLEDTVAANFLPFGAKLRIPDLFGDKVFVVRDRMNQRYYDRLDVWMISKADARQFGVKSAKIEILE